MAENAVSVKMPSSLVDALRRLQQDHHYLDLSEQIRSIVRQRCLEFKNPYTEGIRRLREDLTAQAMQESAQTTREQVLQDLIRLLREGER